MCRNAGASLVRVIGDGNGSSGHPVATDRHGSVGAGTAAIGKGDNLRPWRASATSGQVGRFIGGDGAQARVGIHPNHRLSRRAGTVLRVRAGCVKRVVINQIIVLVCGAGVCTR